MKRLPIIIRDKINKGEMLDKDEKEYLRCLLENDAIESLDIKWRETLLATLGLIAFGAFYLYMESIRYS